jgi:hypothetical protein
MDLALADLAWLSTARDPLREHMGDTEERGGGDSGGTLLQLLLQRPPHIPVMRSLLQHGARPDLCDPQPLISRAAHTGDFSLVSPLRIYSSSLHL